MASSPVMMGLHASRSTACILGNRLSCCLPLILLCDATPQSQLRNLRTFSGTGLDVRLLNLISGTPAKSAPVTQSRDGLPPRSAVGARRPGPLPPAVRHTSPTLL